MTDALPFSAHLPASWHDALDASLPPFRISDHVAGTPMQRARKALQCYLNSGPVYWHDFCQKEGWGPKRQDEVLVGITEMPIYEHAGWLGILGRDELEDLCHEKQ